MPLPTSLVFRSPCPRCLDGLHLARSHYHPPGGGSPAWRPFWENFLEFCFSVPPADPPPMPHQTVRPMLISFYCLGVCDPPCHSPFPLQNQFFSLCRLALSLGFSFWRPFCVLVWRRVQGLISGPKVPTLSLPLSLVLSEPFFCFFLAVFFSP